MSLRDGNLYEHIGRPKKLSGEELRVQIVAESEACLRRYDSFLQIRFENSSLRNLSIESREKIREGEAEREWRECADRLIWFLADAGLLNDLRRVKDLAVVQVESVAVGLRFCVGAEPGEPDFSVAWLCWCRDCQEAF